MTSKKVPFYYIRPDEEGNDADFSILHQDASLREHVPHRHDHFMIYMLFKGKSTHSLDFKDYVITSPALVFVSPGQIHSLVNSEDAEIVTIAFKAAFLMALDGKELDHLFQTNVVSLTTPEFEQIWPYVKLLQHEFEDKRGNNALQSSLLTAFLQKCELAFHKYHDESGREHYNRILQQFLILIDENFRELTKVSDYAALLFITAGHLNDVVKDITGKNAKQFIDERRILEAKRLLYWTGNSIKSIAWDLGFEDAGYFARYFKKQTGELPKDFQLRINKRPHR